MNLETFKWDIDADGIAHAIFDVPGRSMNTLTGKAVADIIAITKEIATNDTIKGLVLVRQDERLLRRRRPRRDGRPGRRGRREEAEVRGRTEEGTV